MSKVIEQAKSACDAIYRAGAMDATKRGPMAAMWDCPPDLYQRSDDMFEKLFGAKVSEMQAADLGYGEDLKVLPELRKPVMSAVEYEAKLVAAFDRAYQAGAEEGLKRGPVVTKWDCPPVLYKNLVRVILKENGNG